LRAAQIKWIQ